MLEKGTEYQRDIRLQTCAPNLKSNRATTEKNKVENRYINNWN